MTGPPTIVRCTESAPTGNRAPQQVLVRLYNGELVGRVSLDFANDLLASGVAQQVGKTKLRYIRLEPGIFVNKSCRGWTVIDEHRQKYGDDLTRATLMHIDRRSEYLRSAPIRHR